MLSADEVLLGRLGNRRLSRLVANLVALARNGETADVFCRSAWWEESELSPRITHDVPIYC